MESGWAHEPMTSANRSLLQMVLATDSSLSAGERATMERLVNGQTDTPVVGASGADDRLLTQKQAAQMLSVSRVTIWRMTKECVLHPTEILPGTWRYPYRELAAFARVAGSKPCVGTRDVKSAA